MQPLPTDITHLEFAARVAAALAFGSAIGLERQWRQRMAGLRTNALVATGTALFVLLAPLIGVRNDPTQIPAYVVSGIGFLAGGVIFKERLSVSGLNTAATLWCTAAIGTLAGFGFYIEGAIGVAAVLCANVVLRPIVQRINRAPADGTEVVATYEIHATCRQNMEERVRTVMIEAVRSASVTLHALYSDDVDATALVEVVADVAFAGSADTRLEQIVGRVGTLAGVSAVSWKTVPTSDDERDLLPEA